MVGILMALVCGGRAEVEPPLRMDLSAYAGQVEVTYWGRHLAVYQFQPKSRKPFLINLTSLDGRSVLQEGASGAPERHGMCLGFQVDDLSFWREEEGCGWQRSGPEVERRVGRDDRGRLTAEFNHAVYWMPAETLMLRVDEAWLIEDRRLRFLVEEGTGEVAVEWESAFRVGEAAAGAMVGMQKGEGLGLQLAPEFERIVLESSAVETNAGAALRASDGAACWVSLAGEVEGRPLTLTVYADSQDSEALRWTFLPGSPAHLIVRPNPASWPKRFQPGDRFGLRFLATAHPRRMTSEALRTRQTDWLRRNYEAADTLR